MDSLIVIVVLFIVILAGGLAIADWFPVWFSKTNKGFETYKIVIGLAMSMWYDVWHPDIPPSMSSHYFMCNCIRTLKAQGIISDFQSKVALLRLRKEIKGYEYLDLYLTLERNIDINNLPLARIDFFKQYCHVSD